MDAPRPAPAFAPSPPLSASSCRDEFDCELDTPARSRQRPARTDSSPASSTSSSFTRGQGQSVVSSFTSDCPPKEARQEEEPHISDFETAISLIRASKQGVLPSTLKFPEWTLLHITPQQYANLHERLRCDGLIDYFEDKIRYDWNPDSGVLVLRLMATPIHEHILQKLGYQIQRQIDDIAETDSELSKIAARIEPYAHSFVRLPRYREGAGKGKKSPDAQFRYDGTTTPQLIIEVGYSQKANSLQDLAKDYYECSDGIKTVVTIDIPYQSSTTAAFCVYRGPRRIIHNRPFRDAQGDIAHGSLQLFLSDFVPDKTLRRLSPQVRNQVKQSTINIPNHLLCKYLATGEEMEARERKAQVDIMPATQAQSSKKRVHWDSGNVDEDEDEGAVLGSNESSSHGNSDGSYDEKPLSKRRKTHQGTTDEAHVLPQRRRTRSMSRAEDATPRRTRSRSRATE